MWKISDEKIETWNIWKDGRINRLRNCTILVTGATGLIGQAIVKVLTYANKNMQLGIRIIAVIRNIEKAKCIFGEDLKNITVIESDITTIGREALSGLEQIHYIIHGASITSSKAFIEYPVETILTGVQGTNNILQLSKTFKVKSMVYLSSMEVYGTHESICKIKESDIGYLNPLNVRNSYPESKRLIESFCVSYSLEYGVPVKIVRLAQTFGPGVEYDDERVFMDFARCAIENRNIILHTSGLSERMYLYVYDAVEAIFYVLLKGKTGSAYNTANKETYCSIREMAELVKKIREDSIDVQIQINNQVSEKYLPTHHLYLETAAIEELGWKPRINLEEMYRRLILSFE